MLGMKNLNKEICIIGSGPTAVSLIKVFTKNSENIKITVITSGSLKFFNKFDLIKDGIRKLNNKKKYEYWLKSFLSQDTLIPKKLYFNDADIYGQNNSFIFDKKKINFDVSYQIGGLSNVWGGNVSNLSKNDFDKFGYEEFRFKNYFKEISEYLNITGEYDDIDYNKDLSYSTNTLNYNTQAKFLVKKYSENLSFFQKIKFRIGFAKLAINTMDESSKCENCGLCMFGCHKDSIYNSSNFFKIKEKKYNLIDSHKVVEVNEHDDKVILSLQNENNHEFCKKEFDKVIFASGTIQTSAIILKFLKKKYDKIKLTIKDSTKYFFLFFTKKKKNNEHLDSVGLSQNFIQTEIKSHTFHIQLYDSNILIKMILRKFFKNKFTESLFSFFKFFFDRLMVGVVYFPSEISNSFSLDYNLNSFILNINKNNKNKFNKFFILLYIKFLSLFTKLNSFPLPFFLKGKVGISQHFGSSLPLKKNPEVGECYINGKLYGANNIYIADTSSLTRIPSTPTTLLTMCHARRIAENILLELKKK